MTDPAEYFAAHTGPEIPTPVLVRVGDKPSLVSLSSLLYGPPPPEPVRRLQRRMADLIVRRVSHSGSVTRDELLAGGFTQKEIDRHWRRALGLAGVHRLGETL